MKGNPSFTSRTFTGTWTRLLSDRGMKDEAQREASSERRMEEEIKPQMNTEKRIEQKKAHFVS